MDVRSGRMTRMKSSTAALLEDPGIAYVASFLHMWAAPASMFVLGVAALAGSLRG